MQYYQEITLLPDDAITPNFLWQKIFTQWHIARVDLKNKHNIHNIGISFPDYYYQESYNQESHDQKSHDQKSNLTAENNKTQARLGNRMRVFAHHEQDLILLDLAKWLSRLKGYYQLTDIIPIGEIKNHLILRRYRHKGLEKQILSYAKLKNMSYEEAKQHCQAHKQKEKKYPYIQLLSLSNKEHYRLSIIQETTQSAVVGNFNAYGINDKNGTTTVPHF